MRKAVGPLLKIFAYLILIALIVGGVVFAFQSRSMGIPAQLETYAFVGFGLTGFLLFLLLYAQGQSVQALVEMTERQAASHSALKEIAALVREQPSPDAYPHMFAPESAAPQATNDWRRPAPAPEAAPFAGEAPEPKPVGRIACSLCGNVQDAGLPSCVHCGATFVTEAAL